MAWYASVEAVSHYTQGLTTTITFRATQRVDGNSYDIQGWSTPWSANTGASGSLWFTINRNSTVSKDFQVSVNHDPNTGVASNVSVTVSNLRDGYNISSTVSKSASFQPPAISVVTKPPLPTNVKLVRNSDTQLTATWKHNGSGTSAETQSYVDGEINKSGQWDPLSTKLATSYTWTGTSANNCYRIRVGAGNAAGNAGGHGYSDYVYTTPATPRGISNTMAIVTNGQENLSFNVDITNVHFPSTKIDFQYSNDNSTWRGAGGNSGAVYTANTGSAILLEAKSMDNTLKSYINSMKNGGKLYIRARIWNEDNSLFSSWSNSFAVTFAANASIYIWVPDGTNINNIRVYVNKP